MIHDFGLGAVRTSSNSRSVWGANLVVNAFCNQTYPLPLTNEQTPWSDHAYVRTIEKKLGSETKSLTDWESISDR